MKTIVILLTLLLTNTFSHSQSFKFRRDGTTDFIVKTVDSANVVEIYDKTIRWVKRNYDNPHEALKANEKYKMVRIGGRLNSAFSLDGKINYDVIYTLEIYFKDGKYRIKYFHHSIIIDNERPLFKMSDVLNEDTDNKPKGWVSSKKQYEARVNQLLNLLHKSVLKP